jgi:Flp pilus assembly protein TadD
MLTKLILRSLFVLPLLVSTGCAMFSGRHAEENSDAPAAKIAPRSEKSYTALRTQVRDLRASDKLDKAREACREMIKKYPDRSGGYHQLALVADRQKRHAEAQSLYSQALRLGGADAEVFNDLGYSYYLSGQMNKAESALAKAAALAPHEDRYRINLGLAIGQQRRYEDALEQFRLAGSEADAQYNLAFVLATQDDAAGAKACFQRALAADPTHAKSRKAIKSFEQYEVDPALAARETQLAIDAKGYIPYVEDDSRVVQVSGEEPSGRAATAALQRQADAMINARLSGRGK